MVFTLHRYIFREIIKVFLPAALSLTLILSLGMILRPVQEQGVGPQQVFHLIGFFLPITLTFVLPIAALFATSLVYGRFASDNELDACRASGVGLSTLVYPGLALALMIAIANLLLSFHITPAFVKRAEKSLKADVQKIIFRNIQRRGYYTSPDNRWQIYADFADTKNQILSGVVIAEARDIAITKIITCDNAYVNVNPLKRFNEVQITAINSYEVDWARKESVTMERLSIVAEVPPLFGDNIKFKKLDELKDIRADLLLFNPVAKAAFEAYAQFTTELLAQDIDRQIKNPEDRFYQLYSGQKLIRFTAEKCEIPNPKQIQLSENVIVEEYDNFSAAKAERKSVSSKAVLYIEGQEDVLSMTLVLTDAQWRSKANQTGFAGRLAFRGLMIPQNLTNVTDKSASAGLLEMLRPDSVQKILAKEPGTQLKQRLNDLQRKEVKTIAQMNAEMHSRLALGIGCIPLIMIGIGLGIIKKGGHLLSAFGVSSIPAAVLIVCLMSGRDLMENFESAASGFGLVIIWAGPALLVAMVVVTYNKLLEH